MQKQIENVPLMSLTGGPAAQSTDPKNQTVYIRVRRSLLAPIPTIDPPPASPSSTSPLPTNPPSTDLPPSTADTSAHLYLIEGTIEDIRRYAGTTVDWVIKVAHLICDPSGAGHVYTHTMGTPSDWYHRNRDAEWRQIVPNDPLLPGIYEFDKASPVILSRLSTRESRSKTSISSKSNASYFHQSIQHRDRKCVVTNSPTTPSLVASHLIPKRIGTDGAKAIVTTFVGAQAALDIHRFHPKLGILLVNTLDVLVDTYKLGFYHNTENTYALHNFDTEDPDIPVNGVRMDILAGFPIPPLHLYQVTLRGENDLLPPKGIFDWHYLQCVVKRFGTVDYKNFPNIYFFVYPFKTADDDSDDEFDDSDEHEPQDPSYFFD